MHQIAEAATIAHQTARLRKLTGWVDRGQRMAGCQRRELLHAPGVEVAVADQDRTNALLRKGCEGFFEIAIGSGIHNNEFHTQRAGRRPEVVDDGWGSRKGRVGENTDRGSAGYHFVEQLQLFWLQLSL